MEIQALLNAVLILAIGPIQFPVGDHTLPDITTRFDNDGFCDGFRGTASWTHDQRHEQSNLYSLAH